MDFHGEANGSDGPAGVSPGMARRVEPGSAMA